MPVTVINPHPSSSALLSLPALLPTPPLAVCLVHPGRSPLPVPSSPKSHSKLSHPRSWTSVTSTAPPPAACPCSFPAVPRTTPTQQQSLCVILGPLSLPLSDVPITVKAPPSPILFKCRGFPSHLKLIPLLCFLEGSAERPARALLPAGGYIPRGPEGNSF